MRFASSKPLPGSAASPSAGEELGMTQTAVSYQIKLLEENIGEPLFLRRPRQISLTETGERLAPRVTEAFEMLQEAVRSSTRRDGGDIADQFDGDLCLAMARSQSSAIFSSRIRISRCGSRPSDTLIDFAAEAADLAIRSGTGEWPGLDAIH